MESMDSEEQTPHLRLSAGSRKSYYTLVNLGFQKVKCLKSKNAILILALDGVFQRPEREEFIYHK